MSEIKTILLIDELEIGDTFSYLVIIAKERPFCICRCVCGKEIPVKPSALKSGHNKSCGCKSREMAAKANTTHGLTRSSERSSYKEMIRRCYKTNFRQYNNYGGRGIIVCDRWRFGEDNRTGFECFIADMGMKPSLDYSLDRIDSDGGYSPHNCKWSTRSEQNYNTRKRRGSSSKYRNVSLSKSRGKWEAYKVLSGKKINLGLFENEEDAARAVDVFVKANFSKNHAGYKLNLEDD